MKLNRDPSNESSRYSGPLRHLFGRPRLVICVIVGAAIYLAFPSDWHGSTRILIAWNFATWLYIALAGQMMSRATAASMRRRAVMTDESRFIVLGLCIIASVASFAAIIIELSGSKQAEGMGKAGHLGLAGTTIVSAWTFIHLIFAQHYAHEFFIERDVERSLPEDARGGLRFPATLKPTFADFVYYSFVIGCASQTADVETTSQPMRTLTAIHGILSFFFNTTILALTINIAAGLL